MLNTRGFLTPIPVEDIPMASFFLAGSGGNRSLYFKFGSGENTGAIKFSGAVDYGRRAPVDEADPWGSFSYAFLLPFTVEIEAGEWPLDPPTRELRNGGLIIAGDGTPWIHIRRPTSFMNVNLRDGSVGSPPRPSYEVQRWMLTMTEGNRRFPLFEIDEAGVTELSAAEPNTTVG